MKKKKELQPLPAKRKKLLGARRNLKMARSAHAYMRGNTFKFYEWLEEAKGKLPSGPAVWICGDCHVGNLGPIANLKGHVDIQIRDFDQTVIGNPAHDLIRLGLSLATAARGSDLPGVMTAKMIEQMMVGYEDAFARNVRVAETDAPEPVHVVMKEALRRSWKHLARERIEDTTPEIPLGKRFWKISPREKKEIEKLFEDKRLRKLVTSLRSRNDDAFVEVVDAAYWVKGCSSLGLLRLAVLVRVDDKEKAELCLLDIKEAVAAAAPHSAKADMPRDDARRVVEGARHLSPFLGERMLATRFLDRPVFIRELLPQDLKVEIETLKREEAMDVAYFLAMVVGKAHARQMDAKTRRKWQAELKCNRTKSLDAPSWLWSSIVELITSHEAAYLEHCRRYAMND